MFAGDLASFVMELPAYHLPTIGNAYGSLGVGTVVAFLVIAGFLYMLLRPGRESVTLRTVPTLTD